MRGGARKLVSDARETWRESNLTRSGAFTAGLGLI